MPAHLALLDLQPLSSVVALHEFPERFPIEVVESVERVEGVNLLLAFCGRVRRDYRAGLVHVTTSLKHGNNGQRGHVQVVGEGVKRSRYTDRRHQGES